MNLSREQGPVMITKRGQPVDIIRGIKKEDPADNKHS
jgi:hypothetical protein